MVNFYRKFLRSAAQVLAPLTDALKGPGKTISWSPLMNSAFNRAKLLLSAVPELVHSQPNAAISLSVDASDTHIGALLQQQLRDKSWAPLAFFSKKLSDAEKKYSAFDRELLAAFSSVRHFRFMLEGREFTIFTDHKPLTHALFRTSPPWSARQQRQLAYLAEFTNSIVHVPDKKNLVADALSRPVSHVSAPNPKPNPSSPGSVKPCSAPKPGSQPLQFSPKPVQSHSPPVLGSKVSEVSEVSETEESSFLPQSSEHFKKDSTSVLVPAPGGDLLSEQMLHSLDVSSLASFQTACSSVQEMKLNPSLTVIAHPVGSSYILCDVSTGSLRPLVPLQLRRKLFEQLHNISHPGVRASRRLMSSRFVWPGMSRDVGLWAKSCIPSQNAPLDFSRNYFRKTTFISATLFRHPTVQKPCIYIVLFRHPTVQKPCIYIVLFRHPTVQKPCIYIILFSHPTVQPCIYIVLFRHPTVQPCFYIVV